MVSGCFLLLALGPLQVAAPELRSYPPNTITVTTGTGTGTVDDLYAVDGMVYDVVEEDIGVSSTLTATESWIVQGTLDSGTFPDDTQVQDGTGVVYLEADDDLGALTGDAMYLNPTGAGLVTLWDLQWPAATFHWDKVDENPHDGAATMVMSLTPGDIDTYDMEDIGALGVGTKESGSITTVVWCTVPVDGIDSGSIRHTLLDGGMPPVHYSDVYVCVQNIWTNTTTVWATNPATGLEWTLADINAVEAGMFLEATTDRVDVTSVGIISPSQDLNYVLDVRHNVTSVPAGREFYVLTMRALTDPGEDITVSVYDHVAPGWDTAFTFTTNAYATETFALIEADHVNAGEVWLRYTDTGGEGDPADLFNIDLLQVRAYDIEYALEVSFYWVGLEDYRDPRLSLEGYRSDAETISLDVWRTGVWFTLDADCLAQGTSTSRSYTLAPADVNAGTLEVRLIDNDQTDNTQSTIFLNWLSLTIEIREGPPRAPIDVYAGVSYDLWANDVLLSVAWIQTGGPEPAQELGRYAILWADGVEVGTYEIHGDGSTRVSAPWSYFDGEEHTLNVTGAVAVAWPTAGGNMTYYSEPASLDVENLPRWTVIILGFCILLTIVATLCVRAVKSRYEEEPD